MSDPKLTPEQRGRAAECVRDTYEAAHGRIRSFQDGWAAIRWVVETEEGAKAFADCVRRQR